MGMTSYRRRKDVKFINPYTFVPISKGEHVDRSSIESASAAELHTGVLRCRLYVRTPLGIPDAEQEKSAQNVKDHKEYPFFSYTENGRKIPVIPGSSLRGAIRSVFEAATDSCFSTLREDTGLSKRVENRKAYKPGILKWEKGTWHLYQAERYLLAVDPGSDGRNNGRSNYTKYAGLPKDIYVEVIQKKGLRMARTQNGEELRFGDIIEFQPYTDGNAIYTKNNHPVWDGVAREVKKKTLGTVCQNGKKEGLVYMGETFARKKHGESVFSFKGEVKGLSAEQLQKAYKGLLETLEIYRDPAINRSHGHSGYKDFEHAKKEAGIPVWYSVKDGKLCLASIGRTFYNTSLNELVGERKPCKDRERLCEACALFGMAGEESLGSRIRITDARAQEGYDLKKVTLKILGQPRYSYLPFYARRKSGVPDSYDGGDVEIAGRKFYWHNQRAATDDSLYTAKDKTQMNSTMELIMPKAEFAFDIYYDGITLEQLRNIMWCIHFGENRADGEFCYKIGHGKPLGLGSVKLVIEKNEERVFKNGSYTWKSEELPGEGVEPGLKRSKELKKVMDIREPARAISIKYPYICDSNGKDLSETADKNDEARHVWYQKNKEAMKSDNDFTEILPDILDKDQALYAYQKIQDGNQNNFWNKGANRR